MVVFIKYKVTINENVSLTDYASGMRLLDSFKLVINRKYYNDVTNYWHGFIIKFFDVILFLLSSSVTSPSFISISSLDLELWQFSFISDWPEIWKLEITQSEFFPMSGEWGELLIQNLGTNVSDEILLNATKCQSYSFYRFWVIKGNPTEW